MFRLLKTLNGEARERKQSAHRSNGAPPQANGAGKLDIQADGGLLDLDAHDGDLLAHVSEPQGSVPEPKLHLGLQSGYAVHKHGPETPDIWVTFGFGKRGVVGVNTVY